MRKVLGFIGTVLFGICILNLDDVVGARNSRRSSRRTSTTSTTTTTTYATPTEDQCNEDIDYCFNRYCFDKKTLSEGVYSKCGAEPASRILINVEDCLKTREIIKQLNFSTGCKSYSYNRIVKLLANKDAIETGLKRNSKECTKATKALQAAKSCYAIMISSDGSPSVDLYNRLDANCGFAASGDSYMLNRFYQAGDYGESNLGALEDLRVTSQNTQKRENWRQIVDATLAGYTEIAELACGAEDYKITKVNQYALDSRTNSAMVALNAEAEALGRNTANRIVNGWFRQSDCVNSPLPIGGLYWKYTENGDPDCRIVCKEGWAITRDSSTCVRMEKEENKMPDLNIGTDWVAMAQPKEEVVEEYVAEEYTPMEFTYEGVITDNTPKEEKKEKTTTTPKISDTLTCDGLSHFKSHHSTAKDNKMNLSEAYIVEFGKFVKENANKFPEKCQNINLGTIKDNSGKSYDRTFAKFPTYTQLYYDFTSKSKTNGKYIKKSMDAGKLFAIPLAGAIYDCVCGGNSTQTNSNTNKQNTVVSKDCDKQKTEAETCQKNVTKYEKFEVPNCWKYATDECKTCLTNNGYDDSYNIINLSPTCKKECSIFNIPNCSSGSSSGKSSEAKKSDELSYEDACFKEFKYKGLLGITDYQTKDKYNTCMNNLPKFCKTHSCSSNSNGCVWSGCSTTFGTYFGWCTSKRADEFAKCPFSTSYTGSVKVEVADGVKLDSIP